MENKPKKAETKKKKKFLSGSVLSSWYCRARPDPVGLRRQQLLRNLHKERDRSEMFHSQTPARTWHPAPHTPPRPWWSLALFPPSSGARRAAEGFIQSALQEAQGWGHRTRVGQALRCWERRRRWQQCVPESLFLSDTPDFFFSLNKVISSRVAGD